MASRMRPAIVNRYCWLCGNANRLQNCNRCKNRYFCEDCYGIYHTHHKRMEHNNSRLDNDSWTCSFCTLINSPNITICDACCKTNVDLISQSKKPSKEKISISPSKSVLGSTSKLDLEIPSSSWQSTTSKYINRNQTPIRYAYHSLYDDDLQNKEEFKAQTLIKSAQKRKYDEEIELEKKRTRRFQANFNIENGDEARRMMQSLYDSSPTDILNLSADSAATQLTQSPQTSRKITRTPTIIEKRDTHEPTQECLEMLDTNKSANDYLINDDTKNQSIITQRNSGSQVRGYDEPLLNEINPNNARKTENQPKKGSSKCKHCSIL